MYVYIYMCVYIYIYMAIFLGLHTSIEGKTTITIIVKQI